MTHSKSDSRIVAPRNLMAAAASNKGKRIQVFNAEVVVAVVSKIGTISPEKRTI